MGEDINMRFVAPLSLTAIVLVACTSAQSGLNIKLLTKSPARPDKVIKTNAQWRKVLTPTQYKILRGQGTEAAFCGKFHDHKVAGTYVCAGCKLPLFSSEHKFDSGTGWPSFYRPIKNENVWYRRDLGYGMDRIEILCARCDGHLGHVFKDGPRPTGWRFCLNSDSMTFAPRK
jgi:methionine-R-sulfoxide reductase